MGGEKGENGDYVIVRLHNQKETDCNDYKRSQSYFIAVVPVATIRLLDHISSFSISALFYLMFRFFISVLF